MLAVIFTPVVLIGRWILGPIDRAARFRQAPVRFSIGDFLCLFLAVQLPLTAAYQFVDEEDRGLFWVFSVSSWIIAPIIWWACARALSRAGVVNGRHRFIFLGLVMPVVYYGLLPFVLLAVIGVFALLAGGAGGRNQFDRYAYWLAPVWLMLAVVLFLCGLLTRWMMRQTNRGLNVECEDGESHPSVESELPAALR